jgi:nitrite reductase (NADH) small subunit
LDAVPVGGGRYVEHAGRAYAVIRVDKVTVRVMDDTCPHAGASLSAGHVEDGCVVCPWHAWAFDVHTGTCPDNRAIVVRTYPSRVVQGRVEAQLPPAL